MGDNNTPNQNEKAAKIRRKPERENVLSPTFAAVRQAPPARHQQSRPSEGSLLQRQCSCGKHTIGGGVCEECQQRGEAASHNTLDELSQATPPDIQTTRDSAAGFNLSNIPARTRFTSNGQLIQPNLTVNAPSDHSGIVTSGRNSLIIQRSPDNEWEDASIRYLTPNPFPDILLRQFREKDVDGDVSQPVNPLEGPRFQTPRRGGSPVLAVWELTGANSGEFGTVETAFTEGDTLERNDLSNPGQTRIRFWGQAFDLFGSHRPPRILADYSNPFTVYQNRWQVAPETTVTNAIKVNESEIDDQANLGAGEGTIGASLSQGWSISNTDSTSFSTARSESHSFNLTGGLEGDIRQVSSSLEASYGFETSEQTTLSNTFTSGYTVTTNTTRSYSYNVPPRNFGILIPIVRVRTLELPILNTNEDGEVSGTNTLRMLITQVVGRATNTWPLSDDAALPSVREQAAAFRAEVIASPQNYTTTP